VELKIPITLVSRYDVSRLLRELNSLDDFFAGAKSRPAGTALPAPRPSNLLNQLVSDNQVNLLEEAQRQQLKARLEGLLKTAPQLRISFSSEPPAKVLEQILSWMRQNIHPTLLLQVGLQPNVAAGFMLRTPNKWFDMSLRPRLQKEQPYLIELIAGATGGQ